MVERENCFSLRLIINLTAKRAPCAMLTVQCFETSFMPVNVNNLLNTLVIVYETLKCRQYDTHIHAYMHAHTHVFNYTGSDTRSCMHALHVHTLILNI